MVLFPLSVPEGDGEEEMELNEGLLERSGVSCSVADDADDARDGESGAAPRD